MAAMTPGEYFSAFVLENYKDFQDDDTSIRKAVNVAVPAYHMVEAIWGYLQKNDKAKLEDFKDIKKYKGYLEKTCKSFRYVQAIALAYKHIYPTSRFSWIPSAGAIELYEFKTEDGETIQVGPAVVASTRDGLRVELLKVFEDVIELWGEELNRFNLPDE